MSSADFRLIKPVLITDAKLVASSVPEALVTEYASGATYAAGDVRGVTSGTAQAVYQSLQAGNVGNAPASSPTWWKPLGTVYAAYSSGTTYAKDAIVTDLAAHQLYQSLVAGNVGQALTDKSKWLPLGATNRRKMFDKAVNSQTVAPGSVSLTVKPGEVVNVMMLLNVTAASVTVTQTESGYSRTRSLVRHDVLNWYDWYYEEPIRTGDVVFDDIPPYPTSSLTVTADNGSADAAIGFFGIGKSRFVGTTQWELEGGTLSYSTRNEDVFGNVTMVKRPGAKTLNFEVRVPMGYEDEAFRLLTIHSDIEIMIICSSDYAMGIGYGFLGQWNVPITIKGKPARVEFRGLT